MFSYSDPTGGTILVDSGAMPNYQQMVDRGYRRGIDVAGSEFVGLDDIASSGSAVNKVDIEWPAYPLSRSGVSDVDIDRQRNAFQDEYVEWDVERTSAGRVTQITFTTLFPEYFHALGMQSEAALIDGVKDMIPGANPTTAELFGTADGTRLNTPQKRFVALQGFWSDSPWNNGKKGILSLVQGDNTLGALTGLAGNCAVPRPSVSVTSVCTGPFCGRGRNSDPVVCSNAQSAVRNGLAISLADPIGIAIVRLEGDWEQGGISIPDINSVTALWKITHGGRRAVLTVPTDLTLDGSPIVTGTQVSRKLFVKATVDAVNASDLTFPAATPALVAARM
jgi:hypothetical protein